MGLGKACALRSIHGMTIPKALNAAEGQGLTGIGASPTALPNAKNASCDAHSGLLDSLLFLALRHDRTGAFAAEDLAEKLPVFADKLVDQLRDPNHAREPENQRDRN